MSKTNKQSEWKKGEIRTKKVMRKSKKQWIITGMTLLMGLSLITSTATEVFASAWTANTVEDIATRVKAEDGKYTFILGDTFWGIGHAVNIDPYKLMEWNGFKRGEEFSIPVGTTIHWDGNHVTIKDKNGKVVADKVVRDADKVNPARTVAGQKSDRPKRTVTADKRGNVIRSKKTSTTSRTTGRTGSGTSSTRGTTKTGTRSNNSGSKTSGQTKTKNTVSNQNKKTASKTDSTKKNIKKPVIPSKPGTGGTKDVVKPPFRPGQNNDQGTKKFTVTVIHKDTEGNVLLKESDVKVAKGAEVTIEAQEFEGYKLKSEACQTIVVTEDMCVIFIYEKEISNVHEGKDKLAAAVKDAGKLDLSKYTKESAQKFKEALKEAEAVLADKKATKKQLVSALKKLEDAINKLVEKGISSKDKQALIDAIAAAKKLDVSKFTEESVKQFQQALKEVEEVLADKEATKAEIGSAVKKLTDAMDKLVEKEISSADKQALLDSIAAAKKLDVSKFTEESVKQFQQALKEVEEVLADKKATKAEIGSAIDKLTDAMDKLVEKEISSEDKQALLDAIAAAKKLDVSSFTEESVKQFQQALKEVEEVLANEEATKAEIGSAVKKLADAMNQLVKKETPKEMFDVVVEHITTKGEVLLTENPVAVEKGKTFTANAQTIEGYTLVGEGIQTITVDASTTKVTFIYDKVVAEEVNKENLQTLINTHKNLASDTYTEDSFAVFAAALAEAQAVLANKNATKAEVDAAAAKLVAAVDALKLKQADKSDLADKIAAAEAIKADKYTEESYAALQSALNKAKAVHADSKATQAEINAALTELQYAIEGLMLVTPTPETRVITIRNVTEDGTVLSERQISGDNQTKRTVKAEAKLTADGKGWILSGVAEKAVEFGKDTTVEFVYAKEMVTVAVTKTANGNVFDSQTVTGQVGTTQTVSADATATVDGLGYKLSGENAATITFGTTRSINFAYEANIAAVTINYVFNEGKETVVETENVQIGRDFVANAKQFGGYKLVGEERQALKIETEAVEITFNYEKLAVAEVNKAQLQALVDAHKDTKPDAYTNDSFVAFESALIKANTVLADENTTQATVDTARNELQAAIDGLVEKAPTPEEADKTALKAKLAEAEAIKADDYTEASYEALQEAVTKAKAVSENKSATEAEVTAALNELQTAIDGLVEKTPTPEEADKTALKAKLAEAEAIRAADYTEASYASLQAALTKAKAVSENKSATEAEVTAALNELQTAIDGLVRKTPSVENKTITVRSVTTDGVVLSERTIEGADGTKATATADNKVVVDGKGWKVSGASEKAVEFGKDTVVEFVYEKDMVSVTVTKTAAGNIFNTQTVNGQVGTTQTVSADAKATVNGLAYKLSGSNTATITFGTTNAVNFDYVADTAVVTINHTFSDGKPTVTTTENVQIGRDFTANAQTFDGYTLSGNASQTVNVKANTTITFNYTKNALGELEQMMQTYNDQMLALVNNYRATNNVPALTWNSYIQAAVNVRAAEAMEVRGHTRPNGSDWRTAVTEAGYPHFPGVENVGQGNQRRLVDIPTPETLVQEWIGSSGHRANLLSKDINDGAVGFYITQKDGRYYYGMTYIGGDDSTRPNGNNPTRGN